ncbi:hypothetical protein D3C76_1373270 [compost metagenome]
MCSALSSKEIGFIDDTTVDMDTAVVLCACVAIAVFVRLTIQCRVGEGAQRISWNVRCVDIITEQPVFVLDRITENIGKGFVECTWFIAIFQIGCIFNNTMRQFMAHNIQITRQGSERRSISVTKDNLCPVPEGVIVIGAVVHG